MAFSPAAISGGSNESLISLAIKFQKGGKMDGLVLALALQMEDDELLEEIATKPEKA